MTEGERVLGHREKVLWYTIRQGLIILLGGIEDYLGCKRSIVPKHEREAA